MAFYDGSGNKIRRNSLCLCGSGKKHKHCHGKLDSQSIPELDASIGRQINKKLHEIQAKKIANEAAHGKGRPIITTEFNDWRVVAVGNEIHYAKKEKTKYFVDFLNNYIRSKLDHKWGNVEIAKPFHERHQVLKWYESMCHFQAKQKPVEDGTYQTHANGSMLSWVRLAYDLYLIKHNAKLQEKFLHRLKNKQQFQGARFELLASAAMIVAGFEIEFEDETDIHRKHAEFLATSPYGLKIAVEAKSRHRDGVLDYKLNSRNSGREQLLTVAVESLIRKALGKEPEMPFFIFIDVNLPYSDEMPHGNPWFKEIAETVERLRKEWLAGTFPANAIFFCNDPTYQEPDTLPNGQSFWCYEVTIDDAKYPLQDTQLPIQIAQALIRRTNIPNEYPES